MNAVPLLHPAPLREGSHIRVISPSGAVLHRYRQRARRAQEALEALGLRVSFGANAFLVNDDGTAAGSPSERAGDLMDAFLDPDVDAVLSAHGGVASAELLPLLDEQALRRHPKAFLGNSDNVWLNQYLHQTVGLSSYYGVTFMPELGESGGPFPETLESLRTALMSPADIAFVPMSSRSSKFLNWAHPDEAVLYRPRNHGGGWNWIQGGRGTGALIGGEISLLIEMAARRALISDATVLFWDVGLYNNRAPVDQLRELADLVPLDSLAGMIVGPDVRYTPVAWATQVERAVSAVVPSAQYPILVNADLGHLDPKWVVPYGREVVLDSSTGLTCHRTQG